MIDRKGVVAYQLELPSQLSGIHDVFHISQLKKCLRARKEQLPLVELNIRDYLSFSEPIRILETSERVTQNKRVKMCKVQWKHYSEKEATWEREDDLKIEFPHLFDNLSESQGRDSS